MRQKKKIGVNLSDQMDKMDQERSCVASSLVDFYKTLLEYILSQDKAWLLTP